MYLRGHIAPNDRRGPAFLAGIQDVSDDDDSDASEEDSDDNEEFSAFLDPSSARRQPRAKRSIVERSSAGISERRASRKWVRGGGSAPLTLLRGSHRGLATFPVTP